MGWDAYARPKRGNKLPAKVLSDFGAAADKVKAVAGSVDGLLREGGLDVSTCAHYLEEATTMSAWDENGWDVATVRHLASVADWEAVPVRPGDEWAAASARAFLDCCARHGLRIAFSY